MSEVLDFVMHVCSQLISSTDTQIIISLAFFTLHGLFVSHASHKGFLDARRARVISRHSRPSKKEQTLFALFPEQVISSRQNVAQLHFLQINQDFGDEKCVPGNAAICETCLACAGVAIGCFRA